MGFRDAGLFAFEEVCSNRRFIVPEFQRGYAWEEEHWRALWDDVKNVASRAATQHYGGAIMISGGDEGQGDVNLIDGQQRLTSLALLLSALGAEAFPMGFKNNEGLQTYFDYYALKQVHLAPQLPQHRSYYTRNLARAAAYFESKAADVSEEERKILVSTVQKRIKLFVLVIQPEFDVHVAFETINNRGKPLSTLEKLKNRLIYLASNADDVPVGQVAKSEVHRCWKSVYTWLGAGASLLDDDEFLRAHSMGWFKHERKAEWLNTELFDEKFSSHRTVPPEEIVQYVRSLELAAACWHHINEPGALPPAIGKQLAALQKTASASSKPLLLWALIRLADEHKYLNVVPSQDSKWYEPFSKLISEAERFAVLVVLANNRLSNVGQSDMNRSAYALAHPGEPLYGHLPSAVPPPGAFDAVTFAHEHLKTLIDNWNWQDETYANETFPWQGYFSSETVQTVIADRLRKGDGFYNWQFGKLIVYLWEDFLRGEQGAPEKKPWEKFAWDESVEHIYPQSPHPKWGEAISLDGRSSKAMREAVTNSIGNLLLLSRSRNSTVSNDPFRTYGDIAGKRARYGHGSYSEVQIARLCDDWTVVQIAARGIAMMRLAQKKWSFELVSPVDKLTKWLPVLFGDQADRVQDGAYTNGVKVDGRSLSPWVDKFERGGKV